MRHSLGLLGVATVLLSSLAGAQQPPAAQDSPPPAPEGAPPPIVELSSPDDRQEAAPAANAGEPAPASAATTGDAPAGAVMTEPHSAPQPAAAQPVYEPEAPAPPRPDPSIHRHDGFYLRMSIGGGYVTDKTTLDGEDLTVRGAAMPIEFLFGGTIESTGLVLGLGLWATPLTNPEIEYAGVTASPDNDTTVQFSQLGPFVDYYLDPNDGLHFLAAVTWSAFSLRDDDSDVVLANAKGVGLTAGVGYEWWIGEQWSAGLMGKFSYAKLSADDEHHTLISPGVVATFTLN